MPGSWNGINRWVAWLIQYLVHIHPFCIGNIGLGWLSILSYVWLANVPHAAFEACTMEPWSCTQLQLRLSTNHDSHFHMDQVKITDRKRERFTQGLVKGAVFCQSNPYFCFWHGESTSTASQLSSPASQKSKDLNKVSLLLQDLGFTFNYGKYWQNENIENN